MSSSALKVTATTTVGTMTADATAKNQRLATARSYSGRLTSALVIWFRLVTRVRLWLERLSRGPAKPRVRRR